MEKWKQSFVEKLNSVQGVYSKRFEQVLDELIAPAFNSVSDFVRDNGFRVTNPLQEDGRRSYKFELAENAYVLVIFRFTGIGEFELRCETFAPGTEPVLKKSVGRVSDISRDWSTHQFEIALDGFVDMLNTEASAPASNTADDDDFDGDVEELDSIDDEFVSV